MGHIVAWPPAWSWTINAGPELACQHRTSSYGPVTACQQRTSSYGPVTACQHRTSTYLPASAQNCWSDAGMPTPDRQLWPDSRPAAMPVTAPLLAAVSGTVLAASYGLLHGPVNFADGAWRGQGHYRHFTKVIGSFIGQCHPSRYYEMK